MFWASAKDSWKHVGRAPAQPQGPGPSAGLTLSLAQAHMGRAHLGMISVTLIYLDYMKLPSFSN